MGVLSQLSDIPVVRVDSRLLEHHPTRKLTVRYECHPHITWLLKLLGIKTYVEAEYKCHLGPYFVGGKILATDNQIRLLKESPNE